MTDIVKRLRATQFDKDNFPRMKQEKWLPVGLALEAADEIERLRAPWHAVDNEDWRYIVGLIPDGGRGRFWKAVLYDMRAALEEKK